MVRSRETQMERAHLYQFVKPELRWYSQNTIPININSALIQQNRWSTLVFRMSNIISEELFSTFQTAYISNEFDQLTTRSCPDSEIIFYRDSMHKLHTSPERNWWRTIDSACNLIQEGRTRRYCPYSTCDTRDMLLSTLHYRRYFHLKFELNSILTGVSAEKHIKNYQVVFHNSPNVLTPLIAFPFIRYFEYWLTIHSVASLNLSIDSFFHHWFKLPFTSYSRPKRTAEIM